MRLGAGDRGRTGTILAYHGILSPGRLPVPPHRRCRLHSSLAVTFSIISHLLQFVNPFFNFLGKYFRQIFSLSFSVIYLQKNHTILICNTLYFSTMKCKCIKKEAAMKKYSGIFLCSDFDGTLTHNGQIPQKNIDAIKYFSKNGGIFSVVSGRNITFLKKFSDALCLNSYVACLNGSEIYHMPTDTLVHQVCLPDDACEKITMAISALKFISDIHVFTDSGNLITDGNSEEHINEVRSHFSVPVRKLLIHNSFPFTDEEVAIVKDIFGDGYVIARSWDRGLEISNAASHKGTAARKMADMVGAHTLICVGNYENDILLLQSADIGYAVDGSLPSLQAAATRTTVSAEDGAIAAIVEEL